MVTSGLNQETIDKYRQVSKNVWVYSRLLAMTAVLSVDTFLGKRLYLM